MLTPEREAPKRATRYTTLDHRLPPVVRAPGCWRTAGAFLFSAPIYRWSATWGRKERRHEGSARVGPGKFLRSKTRRARSEFLGALARTTAGATLCALRAPCSDAACRTTHRCREVSRCRGRGAGLKPALHYFDVARTIGVRSGPGAAKPPAGRRNEYRPRGAASVSWPHYWAWSDTDERQRAGGRPSGAACGPSCGVAPFTLPIPGERSPGSPASAKRPFRAASGRRWGGCAGFRRTMRGFRRFPPSTRSARRDWTIRSHSPLDRRPKVPHLSLRLPHAGARTRDGGRGRRRWRGRALKQ